MNFIQVNNRGPLIEATNYWDSELAKAGKIFCSVNAGAIRVLLPPSAYHILDDMRAAQTCILSRGPWPEVHVPDGIEILWDDGSDIPLALHLTPASFDVLPAAPMAQPGRGLQEWILSVWINQDGRPHKALEQLCYWRYVEKIPCMLPWPKPHK